MANGNFAGGSGTEIDPYLIEDALDLDAVRNNTSASYKLVSDIDLLGFDPNGDGTGWVPIVDFTGGLNGDFHKIKNLKINRPTINKQALFANVSGTSTLNVLFKNISFDNASVTGNGSVATLVGAAYYVEVENCYSGGIVNGSARSVGGLTGYTDKSKIKNCFSSVEVTGKDLFVGGLVGSAYYGTNIEDSYATGKVSNTTGYTGGLLGYLYQSNVTRCYSQGIVNDTSSHTGGLVGNNTGGTVTDSFWDTETSTKTTSAGGTGLTTLQMQTAQTFIDAGWGTITLSDGTTMVWKLKDGEYPDLWFEVAPDKHLILSNGNYYIYDSANSSWVDLGVVPTDSTTKETLFTTNGMLDKDLILLNSEKLTLLGISNPKLHTYKPN